MVVVLEVGMRLAIFIFLISFNQWDLAHNYRLNCDPCVSSALCQAINNYLAKFDPAKVSLKELAEELQNRFTSLQKVSLTKSWDGKIDVQVSSVEPVYIIDLKNSDRVYVLARTNSSENNSRIVPALWINPTCLENLPAVCLNLKSGTNKNKSKNSVISFKASTSRPKFGHGVISSQDANLISQVPAKFKEFLLTLDPEISSSFLIEWIDHNQIILRYCKVAENYSCKLVVRANNLDDSKILTPEFLARCLNLLPVEVFAQASDNIHNTPRSTTPSGFAKAMPGSSRGEREVKLGFTGDQRSEIVIVENLLGGHRITGTSGPDSGLVKFSNFKTKKNSLKNFTIDLRFNKQIVILND